MFESSKLSFYVVNLQGIRMSFAEILPGCYIEVFHLTQYVNEDCIFIRQA